MALLGAAVAQELVGAQISGQPTMLMSDGAVSLCGLRIIAAAQGRGQDFDFADVSINLTDTGVGMVKAGAGSVTSAELKGGTRSFTPIDAIWLRVEGGKDIRPLDGKLYPGQGKHMVVYGADPELVVGAVAATLQGRPVQIYIKHAGDQNGRILFGSMKATPGEYAQAASCMKDLVAR